MKTGIFKDFVKYVSLSIIGTIGFTCYILADTFFIAQGMGSEGITALNLALPLFNLIFAIGVMLGTGGATKYTILRAQERVEEANRYYTLAVAAGLAAGLVFMVIGLCCLEKIPGWLGADAQVYGLTKEYLHMIFWFSPFFVMNQILGAFVRNDGAPRLAMVAMISGSMFNILFDYIFIFPMQLGMFGAALATGASPIFSMLVLSLHYIRKKNQMKLVRRVPWGRLREICSLGMSPFINEFSSGLVILVFNFAILGIAGNLGVAAYGVVANLALVVVCIYNGVAQGMQPLVSESYGLGKRENMHRLLKYGLVASLVFSVIVYVFSWIGTDVLVSAFNSEGDPVLAQMAGIGLRIYFTGFFFAGVNTVMIYYYSASERPIPAFAVSSIRGYVAIIPAILVLGWLGGMTGVWLAYPVAEAIGVMAIGVIAFVFRKK